LFEQNVRSEYNKTEDTQNYEVGRTVTEEKKAIGDIKRLTVAVVVMINRQLLKKMEREEFHLFQGVTTS